MVVYLHAVEFHLSTAWLDIINLVQGAVVLILIINLISIQPAGSDLFRFALLNTRSIRKKATFLKDYVVENHIDLLAITETWLD